MVGRFTSEPVKCMACAVASEEQQKFNMHEHKDEHGIHWVIRDLEYEVG